MAQNPDSMAAWFQLMAQAMQGTQQAQKAFAVMAQSPEGLANFQKWLAAFAPGTEMPTAVSQDTFNQMLEAWQKAMGVVPRSRYLELLEKADAQERRIQELEESNRQLRAMLEGRDKQEETGQKMTEMWEQMMESGLKAQSAWLEMWGKPESDEEDNSDVAPL